VPVLTDGVVTLRAHRTSDAARIIEQCTDPDSLRFTSVPRPYGEADAEQFLERVRQSWQDGSATATRCWAIGVPDRADPAAFAGSIDYRPTGAATAEIGYGLHPAFRGRGLVGRALRLAVDYAFGTDGIEIMHWRAVVGNWASRKAAWRCGFRVEGTVRGFCPQPDGAKDAWVGSLHRDDPRQPGEPWAGPGTR
jgi:RimJ/RimL family protein N-acetyltransferase